MPSVTTTIKQPSYLAAYLLIDRSGSMSRRWAQTLAATTEYVQGLIEQGADARVTIVTFDDAPSPGEQRASLQFNVLRDAEKPATCKPITSIEAHPRGGTPLFDACMRLVALAEDAGQERTALIILTDGEENASKEAKRADARAALDRARERGWQVIFLGADFDAFAQAEMLGGLEAQTITASAANLGSTYRSLAASSARYAASGADISFTQKERDEAAKRR